MLGCFRPDFSSLNTEEKESYKSLHCSMCKAIKKNYGTIETIILNYDLDFIYLLFNTNLNIKKIQSSCTINPLKKIHIYDMDLDKYADLNMIFTYVAFLDKKFDNEVSFLYRVSERLFGKSLNKARAKFNRKLEDEVYEALKNESDLDKVSTLFADIVITHLSAEPSFTKALKEMIKIMYYFDSFKDYFRDIKENKFNVFNDLNIGVIPNEARNRIIDSITQIKYFVNEDSINFKTLEYSLQSKFNKLNIKFRKKRRRF